MHSGAAADDTSTKTTTQPNQTTTQNSSSQKTPSKPQKKTKGGTLKLSETFYASSKDIYECFTDPRKAGAFSQCPANIQPAVGGEFSLYSGTVHGKFTKLEEYSVIEQDWRFNTWEEGCYSKVVLKLVEEDRGVVKV